jgi:hypothetical protein
MSRRIEISLFTVDEVQVSLQRLTPAALDSFITVMNSLKAIAKAVDPSENITFSITEGSAKGCLIAEDEILEDIYTEVEAALEGESYNRGITENLRIIQKELKNDSFSYSFSYQRGEQPVEFHTRLKTANNIRLKPRRNLPDFRLQIKQGVLNQIGGQNPNYHIDYGNGDKITVDCTQDQALSTLRHVIYGRVSALVLRKKWPDTERKPEYHHKAILPDSIVGEMTHLLQDYYIKVSLVEKLTFLLSSLDDLISRDKENGLILLKHLLIGFDDNNLHLSELKTLLVFSKPFKQNDAINSARASLLERYERKKNS